MIVSVPCHFYPVAVLVTLHVPLRPEYIIHGFDHVELIIEPDGHGAVTDGGARPVHDELIDTVEAEDGKDIASFEVFLIVV